MFKLNLILRRKTEDIMIFSPAPWFRILFLAFAVIVAVGIYSTASEGIDGSFIVPFIITAFCIAASLYEESWTFDRENKTVEYKHGLIFLNRKISMPFNEIESLELNIFLRGNRSDGEIDNDKSFSNPFSKENTVETKNWLKVVHPKYHQELILNLVSGEKRTIESIDSRNIEGIKKKAGILSDFSSIKLVKK